jgi:pimeloyl-ACP methyl ester carboxylesterase
MKEKIFFAHANGFPAEVYSDLFSMLPNFQIDYIPLLAHGKYELKNSWDDIVPEIIDYFESNYTEPVWAIGHSFGAVNLAVAAQQRPELFKGLIMMDPPVLSRKIRCILAVTQWFGVSQYFMPLAKKSAKRSDHFPSREFISSKLRNKFLFKNFSDKSFENYIKYGFSDTDNGVKLRFKKEVETRIFALTPPFYKKIVLQVPSYYLYATHGDIADTRPIEKVKYLFPKTTFIAFKGGHLYPFEHTETCVNHLIKIINSKKLNS